MIAKVIPIKRLPGSLGIFDYNVPEEMVSKIKIGQLAVVPFRKSVIYGLIFDIQDDQINTSSESVQSKLKNIERLLSDIPFLPESSLKLMQKINKYYATSLSAIAKSCLPPLQKRKIDKIELLSEEKITHADNPNCKPEYFFYTNTDEHAKFILANAKNQTLIIVPEVNLIDEIVNLFPKEMHGNIAVWHSQLSIKKQFETWLDIRNQNKQIVIGTRGAIFLPFINLNNIIIDYEHDENHKNWDQTPRFHTKDVVQILSGIHNANFKLMSFSPTCESYFHVHKKNYDSQTNIIFDSKTNTSENNIKIVDLSDERRAGRFDIFSDATKEKMLAAAGDIFIYMNRLGFATSAGCQSCGWIARCEICGQTLTFRTNNTLGCNYCQIKSEMHKSCPKCNNVMVKLRGAGTEFIESEVRKLFQGRQTHDIIRIDSDLQEEIKHDNKPQIIVGTKMAMSKINWTKTDVIIFVDIDKEINMPEYLAAENVWHLIHEVLYRKNQNATLLIQSFNTSHLIFRSLNEPDRFYRTELNSRQKMLYPPYSFLVRYFYGDADAEQAEYKADKVYAKIAEVLTKEQKTVKITNPIEMSPRFYRHKYWYVIIAKIEPENLQQDIGLMNSVIPADWKIDPNPISILSP